MREPGTAELMLGATLARLLMLIISMLINTRTATA